MTPEEIYELANKAAPAVKPYGPIGFLDREDLIQEAALGILLELANVRPEGNARSYLLMAGRWRANEVVRHHLRASRWTGGPLRSLNHVLPGFDTEYGELLAEDRRPDAIDGRPTGGEVLEERRQIARKLLTKGGTVADVRDATGLTFSGAWRLCGRIRRETISQPS